jgi:hypothetical protein
MQFQFDFGSLPLYVTVGDEARAYFAIDNIRACLVVFAGSIQQRSLEVIADLTVHNFPFRFFDRCCGS